MVRATQPVRNVVVGQNGRIPLRGQTVLLQRVGRVIRGVVQFSGEGPFGVDFDLFELNVPLVSDGSRAPNLGSWGSRC